MHVEVTDEPYTMEYKVNVIEKNDIYKVRFRLGFRVQPKISSYLRMVINEMLATKEIDLDPYYHGFSDNHNIGDFRFVLVEEEMSTENDLPILDIFIMDGYNYFKVLAGKPEKWFGLDESMVSKELVPVVISPTTEVKLKRIKP